MAETIELTVVTPEKEVVRIDGQMVMAPGSVGEFGVLPNHTPFLTSLQTGKLVYKDNGGKDHLVFVSGGFVEVLPDKVTVLAESAEHKADIDMQRAEDAKARAERRLESGNMDEIDFTRARAALARALHRIKIASS